MAEQLVKDTGARRYVATDNGAELGVVTWSEEGDAISLDHTIVDPAHQGKGVAGRLVAFALDDLRDHSTARVIPRCSYIQTYLRRHPEYQVLTTR